MKTVFTLFIFLLFSFPLRAQTPDFQYELSVQLHHIEGPLGPSVFLSPDGRTAYLAGSQVIALDLRTRKVVRVFGAASEVYSAWGGISGGTQGYASMVDQMSHAALSSNGRVFVTLDKKRLLVWNAVTGEFIEAMEISPTSDLKKTALSSDGKLAAVGDENNRLWIVNIENGGIRQLTLQDGSAFGDVRALRFSGAGYSLLAASSDGLSYYADIRSDSLPNRYFYFPNSTDHASVDISQDGGSFLCSTYDEILIFRPDFGMADIFEAQGTIEVRFADVNDDTSLLIYMSGWYEDGSSALVFYDYMKDNITKVLPNSYTGFRPNMTWDPIHGLILSSNHILWNIKTGQRTNLDYYSPLAFHSPGKGIPRGLSLTGLAIDFDTLEIKLSQPSVRAPSAKSRTYQFSPDSGTGAYVDQEFFSNLNLYVTSSDGMRRYGSFRPGVGLSSAGFDDKMKFAALGYLDGKVEIYRMNGTVLHRLPAGNRGTVEKLVFNGEKLLIGRIDGGIEVFDTADKRILRTVKPLSGNIRSMKVSDDGSFITAGDINGYIAVMNPDYNIIKTLRPHIETVTSIEYSDDKRFIFTYSADRTVKIIDTFNWRRLTFASNSDGSLWIIFTDDGYWDGSTDCGSLVAMVRGLDVWNIDQFAARNNRPDIILERLGSGSPEVMEYYHSLHLRRLARLGLSEERLSEETHVPEAEIVSSRTDGKTAVLHIRFTDRERDLSSFQIYVNDVPLYGPSGRKLSGGSQDVWVNVELSKGGNKIEAAAINSSGAESFRPFTNIHYTDPAAGKLYFLGLGVSEYKDAALNLRYAHKDVIDLAAVFSKIRAGGAEDEYSEVVCRTYLNQEVTLDNILPLRNELMNASVDDTVILFISGHGIHDTDRYATYYYLGYETDLERLEETAIEFETFEGLLHGIPPRRKLFLMDTCGSGEIGPELAALTAAAAKTGEGVTSRFVPAARGLRIEGTNTAVPPDAPETRSYLNEKNRFIQNDLLRRTGAVVFSSCRGEEVSYENSRYGNGLFTYYLIKGLSGLADSDGDGLVSLRELRAFVKEAVSRETSANLRLYPVPQNPTVDRDNIYMNFGFSVVQ